MFPSYVIYNLTNIRKRNIMDSCKLTTSIIAGSVHISNLQNIFLCKFGHSVCFATSITKYINRVLAILRRSYPFKVIHKIVQFISIFVIALFTFWTRAYKCFQYKMLYKFKYFAFRRTKFHVQISSSKSWFENTFYLCTLTWQYSHNPTIIRHGVGKRILDYFPDFWFDLVSHLILSFQKNYLVRADRAPIALVGSIYSNTYFCGVNKKL